MRANCFFFFSVYCSIEKQEGIHLSTVIIRKINIFNNDKSD